MIPKGKIEYRCVVCKQPVKHLHEIFGGKFRQTSIKYNLQVPVCHCSHPHLVHFSATSKKWAYRFCEDMGIDYHKTKLALETRDTEYLKKIAEKMKKKLESLAI